MTVNQNKLKIGKASFCSWRYLVVMRWCDKRKIHIPSSFHRKKFVKTKFHHWTREMIKKPKCVVDYNRLTGSMDKTDMIINIIHSRCKVLKLYKKYFFHLIDICVWNTYCLYKLKTGKQISLSSYRLELICQLLSRYQSHNKNTVTNKSRKTNPLCLIERYFLLLYMLPSMFEIGECRHSQICFGGCSKWKSQKASEWL